MVLIFQNQVQRKVNVAVHLTTGLKVLPIIQFLYVSHADNKFQEKK